MSCAELLSMASMSPTVGGWFPLLVGPCQCSTRTSASSTPLSIPGSTPPSLMSPTCYRCTSVFTHTHVAMLTWTEGGDCRHRCYEAKLEVSEKASCCQKSCPGHLRLKPSVLCHWATAAGQLPTLTILYVLHRWYWMPESHTWQPLSMCRQNSVRGRPENSPSCADFQRLHAFSLSSIFTS